MTKIELAYLAGVMDSDGSFSIARDTWRQRNKGQSIAYQELVAIGQCDLAAVQLAQELFGGNLRMEKSRGENRRPMFYWQVSNLRAADTCRALLPYLRIKRPQAEIVMRLRAVKDRGREANTEVTGYKIRTLRAEVSAEMEGLTREIRALNDSRFPLAALG